MTACLCSNLPVTDADLNNFRKKKKFKILVYSNCRNVMETEFDCRM